MTQLPDKPSELIRLAVADLERAEASPDYIIDMGCWHEPIPNGLCAVCFAGAVIAGTLGAHPRVLHRVQTGSVLGQHAFVRNADDIKLNGLNSLQCKSLKYTLIEFANASMIRHDRIGGLTEALIHAVCDLPNEYDDSPEQFKSGMRLIASEFEHNGY